MEEEKRDPKDRKETLNENGNHQNILNEFEDNRIIAETKFTSWEGLFSRFLVELKRAKKENPELFKKIISLAHETIYDIIMSFGIEPLRSDSIKRVFGKEVERYKVFDNFFGIEPAHVETVGQIYSGVKTEAGSKKAIMLCGPPGSGKTATIERIIRAIEENDYFFALKGCERYDNPLNLLAFPEYKTLRENLEKELDFRVDPAAIRAGKNAICKMCRYRLKNDYEGKIENFPIIKIAPLLADGIGIAVVTPVDPNSEDESKIRGGADISKLHKFSPGDPRSLRYSQGALHRGNRRLVKWEEIFTNPPTYLKQLVWATESKLVDEPDGNNQVYVDAVIIGDSNLPQWKKFKSDSNNQRFIDRFVEVYYPYTLEFSEERKIYEKEIGLEKISDIHFSPFSKEFAAMFAILTRLRESKQCDLITKLHLYNGEIITERGESKQIDANKLKQEFQNEDVEKQEGMFGLSTRYIVKALSNAIISAPYKCVNPVFIKEVLIECLKNDRIMDASLRNKYINEFLQDILHKEYIKYLNKKIPRILVESFPERAESLYAKFKCYAIAWKNKKRIKDPITNEDISEKTIWQFLMSILEPLGFNSQDSAQRFIGDYIAFTLDLLSEGKEVCWNTYPPLAEGIEKRLVDTIDPEVWTVLDKNIPSDSKRVQLRSAFIQKMIEDGHCGHCANVILEHYAVHKKSD